MHVYTTSLCLVPVSTPGCSLHVLMSACQHAASLLVKSPLRVRRKSRRSTWQRLGKFEKLSHESSGCRAHFGACWLALANHATAGLRETCRCVKACKVHRRPKHLLAGKMLLRDGRVA